MGRDMEGKVAIITGSAGGLGRALAEEMSARGCYLVLADINTALLDRTAAELRAVDAQLDAKTVDVRDADQVHMLVEGAYRDLGRIDFLFNNAGVNLCAELRDTKIEDWKKLIDVNLWGVIHGVNAGYPIMREQGFGHIVNTASSAALIPSPAEGAYAATKHAVMGLSSTLCIEAESFGVRVSVVCPGLLDTPFLESTKYVKFHPDVLGKVAPEKPMNPLKAARLVLRGVNRNQFLIPMSATVHVMWRFHRYAPNASIRIGKFAVKKFRDERPDNN